MSSIAPASRAIVEPRDETRSVPPLEAGDRLDQPTFHARYEAMPSHVRAELIGGIVHMPSPAKPKHSQKHFRINSWLTYYIDATPDTEGYDNVTMILSVDDEVQPDAGLLIAPECGGQMRENADGYFAGVPELLSEIASSTESYDLHAKKNAYERAGVREYVVVALRQERVFWFILRNGRYENLPPGPDGILRSETFPGLWLDPAALLRNDAARVKSVVEQGVATPEHTAFVRQLAERRLKSGTS